MNVLIRADVSVNIGTGHVMRCLVLAEMLEKHGAEIQFVCRDFGDGLTSLVKSKGYHLFTLPEPLVPYERNGVEDPAYAEWLGTHWSEDVRQTIDIIESTDIDLDLLVVDHYALDYRWHNEMREYAEKLMVIDDLADRKLDCDFLLDQTFERKKDVYDLLVPERCVKLIGSHFALLRPEFEKKRTEAIEKRSASSVINRVLVSVGGTDPYNVTNMVLDALELVGWQDAACVDVVLGKSAPYYRQIEQKSKTSKLQINLLSDVSNMAELMLAADLAIGAVGVTSWERCCLGLPSVAIVVSDNQILAANNLGSAGVVLNLGKFSEITANEIANNIQYLVENEGAIRAISEKSFTVTDGAGACRVVQKVVGLPGLILRRAVAKDCLLIFHWQTSPGMREHCRNPDVPKWNEHCEWFADTLKSDSRELFIVECKGNPAGLVRLDVMRDRNVYEISVLTAPEYQGMGVAGKALKQLIKIKPDCIFMAEILTENSFSKKLFSRVGFKKVDETWYSYKPPNSD